MLKTNKIIFLISTYKYYLLILFFAFALGGVFHKKQIFPYGFGFYQDFKDFKKYGFNYKKIKNQIAEDEKARAQEEKARAQEEEARAQARAQEELQKKERESKLKIQTLLYFISDKNYDLDYDHIDLFNETTSKVELIGIKGNKTWYPKTDIPLNVFLISIDLESGEVTENLIYSFPKNRRATDVYVTKSKRILVSHVIEENGNSFLIMNELFKEGKKFKSQLVYKSTPILPEFIVFQSGGKISEIDSENILLTVGDFHKGNLLKEKTNHLGKIIRINLVSKQNKIWTLGHRNPQGLTFSHTLDNFIATEHGPEGGDEINLILKNHDYGWPLDTYGKAYGVPPTNDLYANFGGADYGRHEKFTKPIFAFIPSIGIKSIKQMPPNQNEFPSWEDNFLICSNHGLYRAEISNKQSPRLVFYEKLTSDSCRDLVILNSGKFFVTGISDLRPKDFTFRFISRRR